MGSCGCVCLFFYQYGEVIAVIRGAVCWPLPWSRSGHSLSREASIRIHVWNASLDEQPRLRCREVGISGG